MGARPSSFSKGGGFLDNVDVTLVDYQFTDEFNGEPFKPGKIKDAEGKLVEKPHTLNCYITFRVDGADDNVSTTLKAAGDFDAYEVSEDGHVITAAEGGECNINQNTATAKFFASLVVAGFDENSFSDDPNSIDFSPAIGHRMRLIQRTDAERTKKYGQKKSKKNGKSYDRKDLVVDQYYGEDAAPAQPVAAAKKPVAAAKATKPAVASKGKANAQAAIATLTQETILGIVREAGEAGITKSKLSGKILNKLMKNENREDARKLAFDDTFLGEVPGVVYDPETSVLLLEPVTE